MGFGFLGSGCAGVQVPQAVARGQNMKLLAGLTLVPTLTGVVAVQQHLLCCEGLLRRLLCFHESLSHWDVHCLCWDCGVAALQHMRLCLKMQRLCQWGMTALLA